jgi:glycogen operon protein
MLLAGDEVCRSQNGNNNGYAQDNEINWLDWSSIGVHGQALLDFTRRLIRIRKRHAMLHRARFLVGEHDPDLDVKDVTWLTPDGTEMAPEHWNEPHAKCFGMLLDGRARPTGIAQRGSDETLLLIMNAHHDVVRFTLPEVAEGVRWLRLVDTNHAEQEKSEAFELKQVYEVTGRSLLLFALEKTNAKD